MSKKCELIAIQNKIILIMDAEEKVSKGGILKPDVAVGQSKRGKVVSVGPGKIGHDGVFRETMAQVGDVIHVQDYHGGKVEHDGQEYLVIDEDDVLAVIRG